MPGAAKPFHICPVVVSGGTSTHTPPSGSPITPGMQSKVMVEGQPGLVVGDICTCLEPPNAIQQGSSKVFFSNIPAARMGDPTQHPGGMVSQGSTKVIIN